MTIAAAVQQCRASTVACVRVCVWIMFRSDRDCVRHVISSNKSTSTSSSVDQRSTCYIHVSVWLAFMTRDYARNHQAKRYCYLTRSAVNQCNCYYCYCLRKHDVFRARQHLDLWPRHPHWPNAVDRCLSTSSIGGHEVSLVSGASCRPDCYSQEAFLCCTRIYSRTRSPGDTFSKQDRHVAFVF